MERNDKITLLKAIQAGKSNEAIERVILIRDIEKLISPKNIPQGTIKTVEDARHLNKMLTMPFRVIYADGRETKLIESKLLAK